MKTPFTPGFTLIELLIAVVIIAVLTAVALPSYLDFVQTSRRADARNALLALQVAQERYRSNSTTYGNLSQLTASYGISNTSEGGFYNIAVTANSETSYTATAQPAGPQTGDSCGTFAVSNGTPDTTSPFAGNDCWR